MKMEQIFKMLKEMKADRKTAEEDLTAKLDAYQAKTDTVLLAMQ
jgi:hypothetical protein